MSVVRTQLCDRCDAPVQKQSRVIRKYHGVKMTLGFSRARGGNNGWGFRETPVDWPGEVCNDCFRKYEEIIEKAKDWLKGEDS